MKGLQPAVKWGQEGVSASSSLLEKTVIAVPMDTITTLSAFVSLFFSYHITDGWMNKWAVGKHRGECAEDAILV